MVDRIKQFSQGVRTSVNRHALVMSDYIVENFKHPRNGRLQWSWDDHEYQIAIANEIERDMVIKKCAQVGLSELSIRIVLAFCAMNDYRKIAYVLPTAKFSSEFSSTRFIPAIESSDYIKSVLSKEVDNTGAKRIGTCFLIMRGTSGTTAAISVDLDGIITDEIDFCNQEVLGSFASRLQHSDLKITKDFSTPTVPKYGVSALYAESTQGSYMVRHSGCGQLVAPSFFRDVILPGFDGGIMEFRADDYQHPSVLQAYVRCPGCGGAIDWSDFADAGRREWVHKKSLSVGGVSKVGFQVCPWDVPKYNPLVDVLSSIKRYTLHSDWVNFRCGTEYADSENSFLPIEWAGRGTDLASLSGGGSGYKGLFIGVDLGKDSWVVVGVPDAGGVLRIICCEKVHISDLDGANMGVFLVNLFRMVLGRRVICDAAPNYETAMYLHGYLPESCAFGAYYSGAKQNLLDIYNFNDSTGIVQMDRTSSFDATAKAVNGGIVKFSDSRDVRTMSVHLSNMKKIKVLGGDVFRWVSTGPDHFGHALNYCYTAFASVEERYTLGAVSAGVSVGSLKLRGEKHDVDGNGVVGTSGGGGIKASGSL